MPPTPLLQQPKRAPQRAPLRRVVAALWLVVYAVVAVAVPVADASVEHGAPIVAHWEDGSESSCPPAHDTSTCRLCQVLRDPSAPASTDHGLVARASQHDGLPSAPVGTDLRSRLLGSASPRGPPVA